jgi:hypothetical protein
MSSPLVKAATFVRDLLDYSEQLIRIGREGYEIDDYNTAFIAVDSLGTLRQLSSGEKFDSVSEKMTYFSRSIVPIVLSFYGDGAHERAASFSLLVKSQKSLELQYTLQIGVFSTTSITDVKLLAGQQYGERVELNFNMQVTSTVDVDTLRIDTSQISILSENRVEFET